MLVKLRPKHNWHVFGNVATMHESRSLDPDQIGLAQGLDLGVVRVTFGRGLQDRSNRRRLDLGRPHVQCYHQILLCSQFLHTSVTFTPSMVNIGTTSFFGGKKW